MIQISKVDQDFLVQTQSAQVPVFQWLSATVPSPCLCKIAMIHSLI